MGATGQDGDGDQATRRWPLRRLGGDEPIETLPDLLALLLVAKAPVVEQRRALHDFLELPLAAAMPDRLRRDVEVFLDG